MTEAVSIFDTALATEERSALERHEETIERGLQTFVEVGTSLMAIRDARLYREQYGTFEEYCRERWGLERRRAYQLMDAASVVNNCTQNGERPANEAQARPLTKLEPEQQREAWREAIDSAPNGKVTGRHVEQTVRRFESNGHAKTCDECGSIWMAALDECPYCTTTPEERIEGLKEHVHVAQNSGNNEWYTPPDYIDAARSVLGHIDLDPASSAIANQTVAARVFYSSEDDGLSRSWSGRVWMNPPYAADLIGKFSAKLCEHFNTGDVPEAVVLVNNATETQWFQQMARLASAVCFPKGRVRFLDPEGNPGAPLQGQAIIYLGDNPTRFAEAFEGFGFVR